MTLALLFAATALADDPKLKTPVIGDWRPGRVLEKSGVRVELKRVVIRQWADPVMKPEELARNVGSWGPEDYFLYVELGIWVGGLPTPKAKSVRSTGLFKVDFDGRDVDSQGNRGGYCGKKPEDHITLYHKIVPWTRGTGPGQIRVREYVNLVSGEKIPFVFHIPVE